MKKENEFTNDDYNALVHDYARVKSELDGGNLESSFVIETNAFIQCFAINFADGNDFDLEDFFNDVDDCRVTRGANHYSYKSDVQPNDEDRLQPILNELIRAFKNRAPGLGERFERVVEKNERVAYAAAVFLITEYLYLDRSATYHEREQRNETFRLAMFETGNDCLYTAAFNVIRSYAASMARTKLAADVEAAMGGENYAD